MCLCACVVNTGWLVVLLPPSPPPPPLLLFQCERAHMFITKNESSPTSNTRRFSSTYWAHIQYIEEQFGWNVMQHHIDLAHEHTRTYFPLRETAIERRCEYVIFRSFWLSLSLLASLSSTYSPLFFSGRCCCFVFICCAISLYWIPSIRFRYQ